jgi:hypothetical protein
MNGVTMGTIKTTEKNRLGKNGEIGQHKTMPPELLLATGTTTRLLPGKISTKPG